MLDWKPFDRKDLSFYVDTTRLYIVARRLLDGIYNHHLAGVAMATDSRMVFRPIPEAPRIYTEAELNEFNSKIEAYAIVHRYNPDATNQNSHSKIEETAPQR